MNRIILLFLIGLLHFSCNLSYQPRIINDVNIEEFTIDNTSIRAIQSLTSDKMYFAGSNGKVGYTIDAGKSWSIQNISYKDSIHPNFRSMAKTNKAVFALSIENPALLYKITVDTIQLVYKEHHEKVFYDSMHFLDEMIGIAIGDPTGDCMSIIRTEDAGNSWQKIPCENIPKIANGEAAFAASNTNLKAIGSSVWMVSGGKLSRVYKSDDKGKTWTVYDTPIIQGAASQGIYSVDFFDKNRGIIMGGDYAKPDENTRNKAITSDGGKTWKLAANAREPNYKSCVQYVPNTDGKEIFAVGRTGVSYSNDGGLNWKKVSEESYFTIQFVDKNNAWLGGYNKIGKMTIMN